MSLLDWPTMNGWSFYSVSETEACKVTLWTHEELSQTWLKKLESTVPSVMWYVVSGRKRSMAGAGATPRDAAQQGAAWHTGHADYLAWARQRADRLDAIDHQFVARYKEVREIAVSVFCMADPQENERLIAEHKRRAAVLSRMK